MKRATLAAIAAVVLLAPTAVAAQIDHLSRPRSLCATSAQLYCLTILSFHFEQLQPGTEIGGNTFYQQRLDIRVMPFGGGFFDAPVGVDGWLFPEYLHGGDDLFTDPMLVTQPGVYSGAESSPGSDLAREPTQYDLGFHFHDHGTGEFFGCGTKRLNAPCHEVPEPDAWLLLLSGLLGLSLVARRRLLAA